MNFFCAFKDSFQVLDIEAANISATSMTLTWKINDNGSGLVYTYNIEVFGGTDFLNLTVNETQAVLAELSPSTLYNITVHPSFQDGSEGIPDFLQVYTREFTRCLLAFPTCLPAPRQAHIQGSGPALQGSPAECVSRRTSPLQDLDIVMAIIDWPCLTPSVVCWPVLALSP